MGNENLQLHEVAWLLKKATGRQEQNDNSLRSPFFPSPVLFSYILITKAEFGLKWNFLFGRKSHLVSTPKQKPVLCLVVFPLGRCFLFCPWELLAHLRKT